MEHLWAPWRMKFIEDLRAGGGGCLFCELAQSGNDRERLILCRTDLCYAVLNRYPYNNGHLMIVPFKHAGVLSALTGDEHAAIMNLCAKSIDIMKATMNADGFNCGFNIGAVAGAGIRDHVHLHVVPRWNGDNNFMPVLADTRTMPEYLEETYDRLVQGFKI